MAPEATKRVVTLPTFVRFARRPALTFLTVVLSIYGLMHFYAFSKVWSVLPHTWWLGVALAVAGIAMTFSPLLVWHAERKGWHPATIAIAWTSYLWMAYLFLFVCAGLLVDVGRALAWLADLNWTLSETAGLRVVALLALLGLGYGLVEAWRIRIENVEILTPKLASGQVTIVQLSDLHLGPMHGRALLDRLMRRVSELRPDIVVATGDVVDGQGDNLTALAPRLRAYVPPLGAYAVTGNHESYAGLDNSLRFLTNAGFRLLRGEVVEVGGLVFAGLDDPSAASPGQAERLRDVIAALPADVFVVLLKHQPVIDDELRFDLQLSGHVHGGQIFPFVYLTRLSYRVRTGITRLADERTLYVSRGAGTWGPPIRLFAPPEITLITIRSARG